MTTTGNIAENGLPEPVETPDLGEPHTRPNPQPEQEEPVGPFRLADQRPSRRNTACIRVYRDTRDMLRFMSKIEQRSIQDLVAEAVPLRHEVENRRHENQIMLKTNKGLSDELAKEHQENYKLRAQNHTLRTKITTLENCWWVRLGRFLGLIPSPSVGHDLPSFAPENDSIDLRA